MDFTQEYNRTSWLNFLENSFLPDDFRITDETIPYQGKFSKKVTKLGECPSLQLTIFEVNHGSLNDARVGLSKEAFTLVRDYTKFNRALALFVPQSSDTQYRFSYIEFTPVSDEAGKIQRKISNPRRYSYLLGKGCKKHTPSKYLIEEGDIKAQTRNAKHFTAVEDLIYRFSVEVLTKEFYKELFHWYDDWAIKEVKYPIGSGRNVKLEKGEQNRIHIIRLITRFIFVWFIKQKGLVPEWIFIKDKIEKILINFKSDSLENGNYYNGIIQNLFFATLNKPINEREFAFEKEIDRKEDYQIKTKFRDTINESMFSIDKKEFISFFDCIPFLNGGLFECLDDFDTKEYIDGFSREKNRQSFVPNALFWGKEGRIGLIELFNTYNFTIEENTPQDIDVALDPELLGKVFENLLGTFNEETKKTARNESGSFYTPREIVDYMVDASIKEYILSVLDEPSCNKISNILSYSDYIPDLSDHERQIIIEGIHNCKILDPACGSGAFPMGILNRLTSILEKLDPNNEKWKEIQRQKAIKDTEAAYKIGNKQERDLRLKEISDIFEINSGNYGRKLFLIENCIFGVDIQPIAIQISKLRFFISLIVDQKTGGTKEDNYNVLPLPNLETKFVAANTLIGVKRLKKGDQRLFITNEDEIKEKQNELLEIRHKYFNTRKAKEKITLRNRDRVLTKELSDLLEKDGFLNADDASMLAKWNPYCQTKPSEFFDPYWMFGINDGFDIVIGNPPYVESRNDDISDKLKEKYLNQVYIDFGDVGNFITRGSDLLIYFFPRSISFLSKQGIGVLIVQNGWLNTDYGAKASKFLLNTVENLKIIDSSFKHFDKGSANINTVITYFKKSDIEKNISFDLMKIVDKLIITENKKKINLDDNILLNIKWGFIMNSHDEIFTIITEIIKKGCNIDQSFYSIGQGINDKDAVFIQKKHLQYINEKENIINAIYKEYLYSYENYDYFLYHSFKKNKEDNIYLKKINAIEYLQNKIVKRKYPSIIMPRGIGSIHYAGIIKEKALSNSFVDIYMNISDEEKLLNIWLFCNSSLFFLYREISGRKNLGGGLLKAEATDIKNIPLYFPIANKNTIEQLISIEKIPINLNERLETEIQKKIDNIVLKYFDIYDKYHLIISELKRLFDFRSQKAKT